MYIVKIKHVFWNGESIIGKPKFRWPSVVELPFNQKKNCCRSRSNQFHGEIYLLVTGWPQKQTVIGLKKLFNENLSYILFSKLELIKKKSKLN